MVFRGARRLFTVVAAVALAAGLTSCGPLAGPPVADTAEWAGVAASDYQFSTGFGSVQGANQWSYQEWTGSVYKPMFWDAAASSWRGSSPNCVIAKDWMRPDASDAVIVWTAPRAGAVTVRGMMDHSPTGPSDGVRTMIRKGNGDNMRRIWPADTEYQVLRPGFTAQHILTTEVAAGDNLYFHVNKGSTAQDDTTWWDPRITYDDPPAFTLDQAELVMGPDDFSRVGVLVAQDASLATVSKGDTVDFYHSSADDIQKFSGTLLEPGKTAVYSGHRFLNPHNLPGKWWIPNIYRTPNGALLAFAHIEDADPVSTGWWAIGLAYSTDDGNTFTKLGIIVTHHTHDDGHHVNIGGVPFVVKDGYFYIYFDEQREHVARAPVAQVLAAAAKGTVSNWHKYYNGGWKEPGRDGRASPILPAIPGIAWLTHGDAAYSTYTGKYLLTAYNQAQGKGIYLAMSNDAVHFDDPQWIQRNRTDKDTLSPYETIINVDGTDNGVVGQVFYVYFSYRPVSSIGQSGYAENFRWLYRQKVTLNRLG